MILYPMRCCLIGRTGQPSILCTIAQRHTFDDIITTLSQSSTNSTCHLQTCNIIIPTDHTAARRNFICQDLQQINMFQDHESWMDKVLLMGSISSWKFSSSILESLSFYDNAIIWWQRPHQGIIQMSHSTFLLPPIATMPPFCCFIIFTTEIKVQILQETYSLFLIQAVYLIVIE